MISSPSPQPKKSPADGPHSHVSILKRAANAPAQPYGLPQLCLMPLQLCISSLPLAGRRQRRRPAPQHPSCCITLAAPRLLHRAQVPRAATNLHPCRSSPENSLALPKPHVTRQAQRQGALPGAAFKPLSSARGTTCLSHPTRSPSLLHRPRSPGRYSQCHASSWCHRHTAGTSFPFRHPPARFFTRNNFQVSASPSSPTSSRFRTDPPVTHPQASFP